MTKLIQILFFCLLISSAFAQKKYNNIWVTGGTYNSIVNFDSIVARTNWLDTAQHALGLGFSGSHSCICDSAGKLILMCNGAKVYNNKKLIIENGDTLIHTSFYSYYSGNGSVYTPQGSVIVLPFDSNIYKVFTLTYTDSMFANGTTAATPNQIFMHTVDMNLNNGLGKVIEKKKVISTDYLLGLTGMTACRHANGTDWWLFKQGIDTNIIFTYFIAKDSFSGPFLHGFSLPKYNWYDRVGQMAINLDGNKLANVCEQPHQLFVANFDRCLGTFSSPKVYNIPALPVDSFNASAGIDSTPSGVCFSANSQFLYVTTRTKVFQLDLLESDTSLAWYLVAGKDTNVAFNNNYTAQMGPDSIIYIGKYNGTNNAWSTITHPNVKGFGCGYCRKCLRFISFGGVSTPPNVINYNLGASPTLCYPLDTGNIKIDSMQLYVSYQNSSNQLTISIAKNIEKKLDVFSAQGALVYSKAINAGVVKVNVDASSWAKGVYIVRVGGQSRKVIIN
jgi:hypothetical protein